MARALGSNEKKRLSADSQRSSCSARCGHSGLQRADLMDGAESDVLAYVSFPKAHSKQSTSPTPARGSTQKSSVQCDLLCRTDAGWDCKDTYRIDAKKPGAAAGYQFQRFAPSRTGLPHRGALFSAPASLIACCRPSPVPQSVYLPAAWRQVHLCPSPQLGRGLVSVQ